MFNLFLSTIFLASFYAAAVSSATHYAQQEMQEESTPLLSSRIISKELQDQIEKHYAKHDYTWQNKSEDVCKQLLYVINKFNGRRGVYRKAATVVAIPPKLQTKLYNELINYRDKIKNNQ